MRKIEIESLKTDKENQFIVIDVFYDEGGYNYFNGDDIERGYKISVKPIIKNLAKEGYYTIEYSAFSGISKHLFSAKRFSDKKLKDLADSVRVNKLYGDLIEYVINQDSSLKLA